MVAWSDSRSTHANRYLEPAATTAAASLGRDAGGDLLGPDLPPACVADAIGPQQRRQRDPLLRERLRPAQEVGGGLDRLERDVSHQAVEHHRAVGLGHRPDELADLRRVEPGDLGQDPRRHIGRQCRQVVEHRRRDVTHVRADGRWCASGHSRSTLHDRREE